MYSLSKFLRKEYPKTSACFSMKGKNAMAYINCRLKAVDEEGIYEVELLDVEKGQLFNSLLMDKDLKGAVVRAMSRVFTLFQVKVFWIQYYPKLSRYRWILGDGCVVHTPAQLREAGLTKYRQRILRGFLRAQAFIGA